MLLPGCEIPNVTQKYLEHVCRDMTGGGINDLVLQRAQMISVI